MRKILVFLILIVVILLRFSFSVRMQDIYENEIYKLKFELNDGRANILKINDKFPIKNIYANFVEKEDGEYEGYFTLIKRRKYKSIDFIEIEEIRSEKIKKNFLENYLNKVFEKSQEDFTPSLKNMNRAIVLGDSSRMSKAIKEKIRYIGLSHLFAMSGFHISIIFTLAYYIFMRIFNKKRTIEIGIFIFVTLYFLAIKSSPSFTRAYIMLVIYLLGKIFYEKVDIKKSLYLSAIISIIFKPAVIFSISFQLSYLAMISILYVYPVIREKYRKLKIIKLYFRENKVLDYFVLSITIQLFLLPLVGYYFSTLPFLGMLFNVLLIPIASLYIFMNYIFLLLANFNLNFLFSSLLEIIYKIFIYSIEIISRIPYLSIRLEEIGNEKILKKIIYVYLILGITYLIKYCWREFYGKKYKNDRKRM